MEERIGSQSPLERVLEQLKPVKKTSNGFDALCPAHDDHKPSLGIAEGEDGRVLLRCRSQGCAREDIVAAIGLTMRDLFPQNWQPTRRDRKLTRTDAIRDRSGRVEAYHIRYDYPNGDKDCVWQQPDGKTWGLKGRPVSTLPLYGSELVDGWPAGAGVVLVEGEPAKEALEVAGLKALATVTGASKTPDQEVLEVLKGRRVCLWPDNDDQGRAHMERVAQNLEGIAKEIRWYEWEDAPEKGDAADHPVIRGCDLPEVTALRRELAKAPIYSHHIHGGFDENKKSNDSSLPIKSVEEVIEEAGEAVPWVVEDLLARGALTDFSGLAKRGGKTTFWCHAIVAGARGEDHGGFSTVPAKYLYLTEQGSNFATALKESTLVEYSDFVKIVQFKDVSGVLWERLINQAAAEAQRRGLDVLVVDTFAVFARLKGSEENDAGPVADRMRVLRLAAQKYDIAVLLIRHAGKDGTPRGSSAFEAEADIVATLSRPEGRHAPSVRKITAIGRYGELERNVQLQDGRFVSLGTDNNIEFNRAVRHIKAVLPETPEPGMKKAEIIDAKTEEDDFSAATLDRALAWLVKQKAVGERQVMDARGKPKVYWLASENTPPDEEGIYFHQTPSVHDENKSGNETEPSSTSGNSYRGVAGEKEGGHTLEPALEPTVAGVATVTEESSEAERIEKAKEALKHGNGPRKVFKEWCEDAADLTRLTRAVLAYVGVANPDSFAEWEAAVFLAASQIGAEAAAEDEDLEALSTLLEEDE